MLYEVITDKQIGAFFGLAGLQLINIYPISAGETYGRFGRLAVSIKSDPCRRAGQLQLLTLLLAGNLGDRNRQAARGVITSYSIHYTKLYDIAT